MKAKVCECAACVRTARLTAAVCGLRESRAVKDELLDALYDLWKLERVALLCSAGDDGERLSAVLDVAGSGKEGV